jgi:hypothetical protein
MAAVAGPSVCAEGPKLMSKKPRRAVTPARTGNVPVKVRLQRINSDYARPYPPDGQAREWWQGLKNAFGTTSSAFVDASLQQLIAAARLPLGGISETAVNASLAFIEGAKPQDEVECALVVQMACTHGAAMAAGNVPVKVRLRRINSDYARPSRRRRTRSRWCRKHSSISATTRRPAHRLQQLIGAARLPNSGISETAVNASLAFIEGAKPQGEVECDPNGLHPWRRDGSA